MKKEEYYYTHKKNYSNKNNMTLIHEIRKQQSVLGARLSNSNRNEINRLLNTFVLQVALSYTLFPNHFIQLVFPCTVFALSEINEIKIHLSII